MRPLFYLFMLVSLSACVVSKQKFLQSEQQRNLLTSELAASKKSNENLTQQLSKTKQELDSISDLLAASRSQTVQQNTEIETLKEQVGNLREQLTELTEKHDRTNQTYEQLKSQSSQEMRALIKKLEEMEQDLARRESKYQQTAQRIRQQDSILNALRNTIEQALFSFKDAGLTVEMRNGKVYVSLSNRLMFSSGSTQIDKQGKNALKELAKVLNQDTSLSIQVEGHTDNVPVSNLGNIKDNWDLSVLRSTEVVRYLTQQEQLNPKRVIASGRAEYVPIAPNGNPEEKAKNRRTEIIINPALEGLYQWIPNAINKP
ncbi:MAG: hypothetical protein EBS07_05120 [Sphingobacteriia bacterium]|nr:hypothetical protein [Sphingobacteriia bacterium]